MIVHELTSRTITVCVPPAKPDVVVPAPNAPPSNEYWYADVPPVTPVTVDVPFAVPQLALVVATVKLDGPFAVPIIKVVLNVHPLTSLTVTV